MNLGRAEGGEGEGLRADGHRGVGGAEIVAVTNRKPRPHTLVVTVKSEDEAAPPQTINLAVHSGGHGKVTTAVVLDPLKRYDVHTSTVAGHPPVPSESTRNDIPAFGADTPALTLPQRALQTLSSAFAFIRGDRWGR
ncbi:MAG: hypothetical protein WKF94_05005 [Solirubrobacteraceae bacterium]